MWEFDKNGDNEQYEKHTVEFEATLRDEREEKIEDVSFTCPWRITQAHVYALTLNQKYARTHFLLLCALSSAEEMRDREYREVEASLA